MPECEVCSDFTESHCSECGDLICDEHAYICRGAFCSDNTFCSVCFQEDDHPSHISRDGAVHIDGIPSKKKMYMDKPLISL